MYNGCMVSRRHTVPALFLALILLAGCTTTGVPEKTETPEPPQEEPSAVTLVFAGDIMAHAQNYSNKNFGRIWRGVSDIIQSGDLAFANIEAPVADSIPWSTYPQFNMHSEYIEAAVRAGFNVFSLANNHTNDQYLAGIKETKAYFDSLDGIWSCGIKEKSGDGLTYSLIEKNGLSILFVAVTEILNRNDFASYIDYYPPTQKKRAELAGHLCALREQSACDLFVLSVHTGEEEYVPGISDARRQFYLSLIETCGIDIIWANHPHITKPWEIAAVRAPDGTPKSALIMYANGNTISAQRTSPSFNAPETPRDYTGDGLILRVRIEKDKTGTHFRTCEPFFITTYITPERQFVVKPLDRNFIRALETAEIQNWASYLTERKHTMEKLIPIDKAEFSQETGKNEH